MNTNDNSFDPTPRLKSSPVPVLFIPFKNNENNCNYCGNKYSKTLKFEQKYCKICLFLYIKHTTGNNQYLDVDISTNNARCIEHKPTRKNFCTTNIQEWCKYCSKISYFRQIIPNDLSFNNYLLLKTSVFDVNKYRKIDCKLCNKRWLLLTCRGHAICPDCYQ